MADAFRSFYQRNLPDLSTIADLSHRHFRFLLPHGGFLKVPDRIRSEETLQRWLIRYRPSDVYYSSSCWLVPENVGRRERTPVSDNIFLSSDIVFDIDRQPFSEDSLEQARRDTVRLLSFCEENDMTVRYIAFSGSKGFHVVCADPRRYSDPSPFGREDAAKEVRRAILSRVLSEGIAVDSRITADTRRIIRVPGTINSKSGYVCTVLTRDQLERPAGEILKYIPRVTTGTPPIPLPGDDCPLRGARIISWLCHRIGVRSKPASYFSYASYLVNTVPSTPLQVPFFSYPGKNPQRAEKILVPVQERYGLSDIYLFRSSHGTDAVCLRSFPIRRLEKILKASASATFATLVKYRQTFFHVGTIRDQDQRCLSGPPEYVKTLSAPPGNNERFISGPHYHFIKEFLPETAEYPRLHGEGPVALTHTVIEN